MYAYQAGWLVFVLHKARYEIKVLEVKFKLDYRHSACSLCLDSFSGLG